MSMHYLFIVCYFVYSPIVYSLRTLFNVCSAFFFSLIGSCLLVEGAI